MTTERNNTSGYSIQRSYKPLMIQALVLVFVSDVLLVFLLLLIVGLRNALGVDAELIGLSVVLFGVKTSITLYGLYTMLKNWLGISYFVANNKLYIQSDIRSVASSIMNLSELSRVISSNSYQGTKKTDYGDVALEFTKGATTYTVILRGVQHPNRVADSLHSAVKET